MLNHKVVSTEAALIPNNKLKPFLLDYLQFTFNSGNKLYRNLLTTRLLNFSGDILSLGLLYSIKNFFQEESALVDTLFSIEVTTRITANVYYLKEMLFRDSLDHEIRESVANKNIEAFLELHQKLKQKLYRSGKKDLLASGTLLGTFGIIANLERLEPFFQNTQTPFLIANGLLVAHALFQIAPKMEEAGTLHLLKLNFSLSPEYQKNSFLKKFNIPSYATLNATELVIETILCCLLLTTFKWHTNFNILEHSSTLFGLGLTGASLMFLPKYLYQTENKITGLAKKYIRPSFKRASEFFSKAKS